MRSIINTFEVEVNVRRQQNQYGNLIRLRAKTF